MWWNDEYKAEYEYAKECDEAEDPMAMAILLLLLFMFFWPFKAVRNCFDNE
jgi:hypothetical protein